MQFSLRVSYILLALLFGLIAFCLYWGIKCRNPYKLTLIIGKKGSGKTTFLTKYAIKCIKKGKKVYANYYLPGTHLFDPEDMGNYGFEENSVVLVDEAGLIWNNRHFKTFNDKVNQWFKYSRQYRNTIYLTSQADDIDLKIRLLLDKLFLCECKMNFLSIARRVKRHIVVVQPTGDAEGRIADGMELEPLWLCLLGVQTIMVTHIPNWMKYFKSFNPPELPPMNTVYQSVPDNLKRCYMTKEERKLDTRRMVKDWFAKWSDRFRGLRKNKL